MEFKVSGVFDLPRFSPEFMWIRQPYYHILFAASICARFISCHSRKINLFNSRQYVKIRRNSIKIMADFWRRERDSNP